MTRSSRLTTFTFLYQVKLPVVLQGAMGPRSALINGTYTWTAEKLNGKPVYAHVGDANGWMFFGTDGAWWVSGTTSKNANKCAGYAYTEEACHHLS